MIFSYVRHFFTRVKNRHSSQIVTAPHEGRTPNPEYETYSASCVRQAAEAIGKGYKNPEALRELLIWTTHKDTYPVVMKYFRQHLHDPNLLSALINIASEGEDAGDAPWTAANIIEEFPSELLAPHESSLQQLSEEGWTYLSDPAKRALAKLTRSN